VTAHLMCRPTRNGSRKAAILESTLKAIAPLRRGS
jgi:hypothetical protein